MKNTDVLSEYKQQQDQNHNVIVIKINDWIWQLPQLITLTLHLWYHSAYGHSYNVDNYARSCWLHHLRHLNVFTET